LLALVLMTSACVRRKRQKRHRQKNTFHIHCCEPRTGSQSGPVEPRNATNTAGDDFAIANFGKRQKPAPAHRDIDLTVPLQLGAIPIRAQNAWPPVEPARISPGLTACRDGFPVQRRSQRGISASGRGCPAPDAALSHKARQLFPAENHVVFRPKRPDQGPAASGRRMAQTAEKSAPKFAANARTLCALPPRLRTLNGGERICFKQALIMNLGPPWLQSTVPSKSFPRPHAMS